ncbi:MAG: hypothetical protein AAGC86_09010 [Pseudomonadota bacterium]
MLSSAQRALLLELSPEQVDCAIAVMLKILDGKCKITASEARVMTAVYGAVRTRPARHLGPAEHALIEKARAEPGPRFRADVYEARVMAETRISRPVMKAFKAALRRDGVLPEKTAT